MSAIKHRQENFMALTAFDTLAYAKKLIEAGFNPKQAEAQAELQSQILSELLINKLTTKDDFTALDNKIDQSVERLDAKIDQLEVKLDRAVERLDAKIDQVEEKLNTKIDQVEKGLTLKIESVSTELRAIFEGKFKLLYWMFGLMVTSSFAILLRLFH